MLQKSPNIMDLQILRCHILELKTTSKVPLLQVFRINIVFSQEFSIFSNSLFYFASFLMKCICHEFNTMFEGICWFDLVIRQLTKLPRFSIYFANTV